MSGNGKVPRKEKRKKKVFVLLCFTVTFTTEVENVLSLCPKTPTCVPLYMFQHQEESSECHGEIKYDLHCPLAPRFLFLGVYSILSTAMVSECEQVSPKSLVTNNHNHTL